MVFWLGVGVVGVVVDVLVVGEGGMVVGAGAELVVGAGWDLCFLSLLRRWSRSLAIWSRLVDWGGVFVCGVVVLTLGGLTMMVSSLVRLKLKMGLW